MTQLNFDANTVAPSTGSPDPVPNGWYHVMLTSSEQVITKDKLGAYIDARFQIVDGPYQGQMLFDNLNIRNNNETAQKIAYETLSAICHATGVMNIQDTSQLHGIPFKVKAKLVPNDGQYPAKNEITAIRHVTDPAQVVAERIDISAALNPPAGAAAPAPTPGMAAPPIAGAPPMAAPPPLQNQAIPGQQPAAAPPQMQPQAPAPGTPQPAAGVAPPAAAGQPPQQWQQPTNPGQPPAPVATPAPPAAAPAPPPATAPIHPAPGQPAAPATPATPAAAGAPPAWATPGQ